MITKLKSIVFHGLECNKITIEVGIARGLNSFNVVGLPDSVISESKEKIRVAIKNSGFDFPRGKILINLSPSCIKKEGSYYDLPIAIGILDKLLNFDKSILKDTLIVGEMSLDGDLLPIKGAILISEYAKSMGVKRLILPKDNLKEARLVGGNIDIYGFNNISEVINYLVCTDNYKEDFGDELDNDNKNFYKDIDIDFKYIKGQYIAKRALEIAASGFHNILLIGPPGCGKTIMSKALAGILPPLTKEESLEVTKIYSFCGLNMDKNPLIQKRPVRHIHHSSSLASIIGGGRFIRPGEISLAHRGVLFLDEFAEFPMNVLDNLRQPLEDKSITVTRVSGTYSFPANFILVASMNPCKCGYYNTDDSSKCKCAQYEIDRYRKKISGPILDRIDLCVHVDAVDYDKLIEDVHIEPSCDIRERVLKAHNMQTKRFKAGNRVVNSNLRLEHISSICKTDLETTKLLRDISKKMNLSARSVHSVLKVSRTIADIEGENEILKRHVLEAVQYRIRL